MKAQDKKTVVGFLCYWALFFGETLFVVLLPAILSINLFYRYISLGRSVKNQSKKIKNTGKKNTYSEKIYLFFSIKNPLFHFLCTFI